MHLIMHRFFMLICFYSAFSSALVSSSAFTSSAVGSSSGVKSVISAPIRILYHVSNFLISLGYTLSRSKSGNTSAK